MFTRKALLSEVLNTPVLLELLRQRGIITFGQLVDAWTPEFRADIGQYRGGRDTTVLDVTIRQFKSSEITDSTNLYLDDKRLTVPVTTSKALSTMGINTIGDLAAQWNPDFEKKISISRGFGETSIKRLRAIVKLHKSGELNEHLQGQLVR